MTRNIQMMCLKEVAAVAKAVNLGDWCYWQRGSHHSSPQIVCHRPHGFHQQCIRWHPRCPPACTGFHVRKATPPPSPLGSLTSGQTLVQAMFGSAAESLLHCKWHCFICDNLLGRGKDKYSGIASGTCPMKNDTCAIAVGKAKAKVFKAIQAAHPGCVGSQSKEGVVRTRRYWKGTFGWSSLTAINLTAHICAGCISH